MLLLELPLWLLVGKEGEDQLGRPWDG